jgi:4-hydroxybenzoate polyprenyltransferase
MTEGINKILLLTRAKDWRLSFVPFIIGCVYLWLWWFKVNLSLTASGVFLASFITTFGFAALGYFINEFFDMDVDTRAGKINKLKILPPAYRLALFFVCALTTFLPWVWLPKNMVTYILIVVEVALFLLYSLPFPRLKSIPLISGFIDSGYAYVVPLVLSFYTYSLFANNNNLSLIYLLAPALFLIGFRNITIHHVNDIFKDMRSGAKTLPQQIGINATGVLILVLLVSEIMLVLIWSVAVAIQQPVFLIWTAVYVVAIAYRYRLLVPQFRHEYLSIEPIRHLTDPVYQYVFPATMLLLAITVDYRWVVLVPFHFAALLTRGMQVVALQTAYSKTHALYHSFLRGVVDPIKISGNYIVYFSFRVIGINLRKENTTAVDAVKKRLRIK